MSFHIPQHIAIIMDGNGRWANKRGLPRKYGHRQGAQSVKRVIRACLELGVRYLTLYTFSTENWKRPKKEVDNLMELLENYIDSKEKSFPEYERLKVTVIGRWWELSGNLPSKIKNLMKETEGDKELNLILAINYGGRREILDAVYKMLEEKTGEISRNITEENFRKYLYAPEVPDPDIIIRTAGEFRISNFLLWQSSYAELYITKKLWPDFRKTDLKKAIKNYQKRRRKFGGI